MLPWKVPQPMSAMEAVKQQTAEAVRRSYLDKMRIAIPAAEWLEAEAETIEMSNIQLRGFVELLIAGEHLFNAANLMKRVQDHHVLECVQRVRLTLR